MNILTEEPNHQYPNKNNLINKITNLFIFFLNNFQSKIFRLYLFYILYEFCLFFFKIIVFFN